MMKVRMLAAIAVLSLTLGSASGATTYWEDRFRYDRDETDKYPPEFSIDLFGTYTDHNVRNGRSEDRWGGGLGFNFFFTRYFGIGIDSHTDRWQFPEHANASVIVRFPSGSGFAPYGFGGAGREWGDIGQWSAHAGGGLELRFNRYTGIFADGRAVFPEETPDFAFARAGIRIGF